MFDFSAGGVTALLIAAAPVLQYGAFALLAVIVVYGIYMTREDS